MCHGPPGAKVTSTDLPDVLGNLRYNVMRNTKDRCRYIPVVGRHFSRHTNSSGKRCSPFVVGNIVEVDGMEVFLLSGEPK